MGRGRSIAAVAAVALSLIGCTTATAPATPSPMAFATDSPSTAPTSTPLLTAAPLPTPKPFTSACQPTDNPTWSIARRWDEALLDAIRRALPNPPVHARNLYHLSIAMWDAWAAFDPTAIGVISTAKFRTSGLQGADVEAARREAISYAAYGVLTERFQNAVGAEDSLAEFDAVMADLCYPLEAVEVPREEAARLGDRIAKAVIDAGLADGSNEDGGYRDPGYAPLNKPLTVAKPGASLVDPTRWQPLEILGGFSQNGIPTGTVQVAVDPHWGHVLGFGDMQAGTAGTPIDPGPPPQLGDPTTDAALKAQVVEVIRDSSYMDARQGVMIDISPGARGGNDLATNDGTGHVVNPVTGQPYASELVNRADFVRVMAEFWADGPRSETPPGHWNVIANDVSDELDPNLRIGGRGEPVGRLEWDVKLYLALNGAVHNAAIAAWGLKGRYDSIRPISLIRYMGGLGQSSDPNGPAYNRKGLPFVRGLIEVVTTASSRPGQRHAALAAYVGKVAIRAWAGNPNDPADRSSGVRWILATRWVPYQLPTFVTPSFPGYVSGHSAFSRAAAEVMTGFTGSQWFPGGVSGYTRAAGSLSFEKGPTADIVLEWATYYDAADQAGQSRLYGGIHIQADDFGGRAIGSVCGRAAWTLAQQYYAGALAAVTVGCWVPSASTGIDSSRR
jgi:hypothetical protein